MRGPVPAHSTAVVTENIAAVDARRPRVAILDYRRYNGTVGRPVHGPCRCLLTCRGCSCRPAASAAISGARQAFSVTGSVHAGNSDPCETPADVVEIRGAFIFTARSELRKVLFLAPSVCGFFVCV